VLLVISSTRPVMDAAEAGAMAQESRIAARLHFRGPANFLSIMSRSDPGRRSRLTRERRRGVKCSGRREKRKNVLF
jgi:hypothetical protein